MHIRCEFSLESNKKNPKPGYARLGSFAGYYFNIRLLSWTAIGAGGLGMGRPAWPNGYYVCSNASGKFNDKRSFGLDCKFEKTSTRPIRHCPQKCFRSFGEHRGVALARG
jgi:hypothetical protein